MSKGPYPIIALLSKEQKRSTTMLYNVRFAVVISIFAMLLLSVTTHSILHTAKAQGPLPGLPAASVNTAKLSPAQSSSPIGNKVSNFVTLAKLYVDNARLQVQSGNSTGVLKMLSAINTQLSKINATISSITNNTLTTAATTASTAPITASGGDHLTKTKHGSGDGSGNKGGSKKGGGGGHKKKPPQPIVGGGGPNPGPIKPPQAPGGGNPSA